MRQGLHVKAGLGRGVGRFAAAVAAVALSGCISSPPYVGERRHPQIRRGRYVPGMDEAASGLAFFEKLVLWNRKVMNHEVSASTEEVMAQYLDEHREELAGVKVRLNQWAPLDDLKRVFTRKGVGWPYKILVGLPTTLVFDVILTGRVFPGLLGAPGDHYNPYTDTVHLFSDDRAVALHELGHATDWARTKYKGTYALIRIVPFINLPQEAEATKIAIDYLEVKDQREDLLHAYEILYPAFGTYAGSYAFPYVGSIAGAAVGHVTGRQEAAARRRQYSWLDQQKALTRAKAVPAVVSLGSQSAVVGQKGGGR